MDVLIGLFQQIAGVNYTCAQLSALAAQYACMPRALQLPALIYLATLIVANGPSGGGGGSILSGIGPPQIQGEAIASPPVANAIYSDITIPSSPNVYIWANGQWVEVIG